MEGFGVLGCDDVFHTALKEKKISLSFAYSTTLLQILLHYHIEYKLVTWGDPSLKKSMLSATAALGFLTTITGDSLLNQLLYN